MSVSGTLLDWIDLPDPSVQDFEDPFRDLSPEQFDDVLFVVRLRGRSRQQAGTDEERQKWQELLSETEDALLAGGTNIDWLLNRRELVAERRRKAGVMGTPQFDGQTITLTGFVAPAPNDPDGQPVAYLVPERGMCSHVPPPPPSQMIRVRLKKDWTPNYVHQPIRLTGKITIDATEQAIVVMDGLEP